jgi:ABC-2 type transport system ATP-binding protein
MVPEKTTLMKMIAGHINASSGSIEIDGKSVSTAKMPDTVSFIESKAAQFNTTLDNLIRMASGLDSEFSAESAHRMAKRFHLDTGKKYRQLSFGMQTMFSTLLSLASNRKIILLDEPLLGLDAIMRNKFYNLINDGFEHHPRTILISTHMIDEMTKSAEELLILDKGKIMFRSAIGDIEEKAYSITGASEFVAPVLKNLNVISSKTIGGHTTAYIYDKAVIPAALAVQPIGLQEFFINLVGGDFDEEEQ